MNSSQEDPFAAIVRVAATLLDSAIRLHVETRKPHPAVAELTDLLDYFYRMKCEAGQTRAVDQSVREAMAVLALLRSEWRPSPILGTFEYAQRLETVIWGRVLRCLPPRITPVPDGFLNPKKTLYLPGGSSRTVKAPKLSETEVRLLPDPELNEALAKLSEPTAVRAKLQDNEVLEIPNFEAMRDAMDWECRKAMRYVAMTPGDRSEFLARISGVTQSIDSEHVTRKQIIERYGKGESWLKSKAEMSWFPDPIGGAKQGRLAVYSWPAVKAALLEHGYSTIKGDDD